LKTSDFDYHLPPELIAQTPIEPRDQSRLMVVDRESGSIIHTVFSQLPGLLRSGDLLVCNDSRVVPARITGRKEDTGGKVEILLLRRCEEATWEVLLKPSRRLRAGGTFRLITEPSASSSGSGGNGQGAAPASSSYLLEGQVIERTASGTWMISFNKNPELDRIGHVPLPPYVKEPLRDPERYQTVYARAKGSVAAPTAGLHFTPALMTDLSDKGIGQVFLTVHIGLDTFRPVVVEDPADHPIHTEWGTLGERAAMQINEARSSGGRAIAVGTSSVRLLETAACAGGEVRPFSGWARLFIIPGHQFRAVDCLLTNFHLPRTSLMMLVSAIAGRELILEAYHEAIRERYRFYSFGDAMLIV